MVRRIIPLFFIVSLLISCTSRGLEFTGNLSQPLLLQTNSNLAEFLTERDIDAEYALLCGKDGTAAYVNKVSFPNIDISRQKGKWNSTALDLPEVVNINNLEKISLFTRESIYSLNIIRNTTQIDIVTPFEAETDQYELLGRSIKNGYAASKFKFQRNFRTSTEADSVLAIFNNGTEKWLKPSENGELLDIEFEDYYFSCEEDTLVTLWENQPEMNAYKLHETLNQKLKDERSLVIFLDSYGWLYKEHLKAIGYSGWLSDLDFAPLRVPYPPRTFNSYWVIGSGSIWQNRKVTDEYFADLPVAPEKALIIEADMKFYPSPIRHILNTDVNNNGTIDDEIWQDAVDHLDDDLQFLLVHFHSLDDTGHATGAYSSERFEVFQQLEKYIRNLTTRWNGSVYLFSDHGMHTEGSKGTHYRGTAEDILGVWGKLK